MKTVQCSPEWRYDLAQYNYNVLVMKWCYYEKLWNYAIVKNGLKIYLQKIIE